MTTKPAKNNESTKETKATAKTTNQRSIRVSQDDWETFKALCEENSTTITEQLIQFMRRCNESGELPITDDEVITSRVKKLVEEKLTEALAALDKQVDEKVNTALALATKLAQVELGKAVDLTSPVAGNVQSSPGIKINPRQSSPGIKINPRQSSPGIKINPPQSSEGGCQT